MILYQIIFEIIYTIFHITPCISPDTNISQGVEDLRADIDWIRADTGSNMENGLNYNIYYTLSNTKDIYNTSDVVL